MDYTDDVYCCTVYTLIRPRRIIKAHHRKHHHHHHHRRSHHKSYDTFSQVTPIDQWYYERARRPASGSRRAQSYNVHTASTSTSKRVKLDMSASADLVDTLRESTTPDRPRHTRSSSWRPDAVPPRWPSSSASSSAASSRSASVARHPDSTADASIASGSDQDTASPQMTIPRGRQRHTTPRRPAIVLSSRSSSTSSYRQMTEEAIRVLRMVERLEESGASVSRSRARLPRVIVAEDQEGERTVTRQDYASSSSACQHRRGRRKSKKRISAAPNAGEGTSSTGSSTPQAEVSRARKKNPVLDAVRVEEGLVSAAHDSEITIREPQAQSRVSRRMSVWLLIVGTLVIVAFLSGFSLMRGPMTAPFSWTLSTFASPPPSPSPSTQLLGRLSSWLCTILYVTSRLPQIWENQTRRSCEGISILLFIAAFLGNLFYAISILSNPESGQWIGRGPVDGVPLPDDPWAVGVKAVASDDEAHKYLMESMPFLIGSAGTLVFDAVVLWQWYLFGRS